jgi:septal ring factor EnvC (AmiA/AmiB activator)
VTTSGDEHQPLQRELERALERERKLQQQAFESGRRLTEVEQELAQERQRLADLEQSQDTLASMQATRLWRWGTAYWRVRDRLLRRRL